MNASRRIFLKNASLATLAASSGCHAVFDQPNPTIVNDVHTQLNPTRVRSIISVNSINRVSEIIRRARREDHSVSVAGGRHAGGGQQFATDAELIDTRELHRVLHFDAKGGTIEVETGIQWPELITFLRSARNGRSRSWSVAQKQTGTDRLSIGGTLSANAHGRGLTLPPFVSNVESFTLVDANGDIHACSRHENAELFKLAIGGYGLFGFIYSAKLRLVPLRKVRRIVKMAEVADLPELFAGRIADGFIYGDFQFAIDSTSDDFITRGILACYEPVPDDTPSSPGHRALSGDDWKMLIYLAHTDPARAFDLYAKHYLATSGQIYESDTQYASDYFENYHRELDTKMQVSQPATEVIGELYVPRNSLPHFLSEAREELRRPESPLLIYGTIRLIEKDTESFLPWAKQSYSCVIFNLHTPHSPEGMHRTANTFRRLIDLAIHHDGSYYLTYHRYATREQLLACYPQFPEFLRLKLHYDPAGRFQSDWYRHYKKLLA
jgi:FAD/FMN-containing dehydrogenase